jgi:enamine deaminase RidA (YjgF/YER057c/UK114 family)
MNFDEKIDELFIDLPEPSKDTGAVVQVIRVGKLIHVSGVLPFSEGRIQFPGRVGIEVKLDSARLAARTAAVMVLAILNHELGGSLNKVKRVISVDGFVACGADFIDHPKVLNGASDLFAQIFGPYGKHVRTSVGITSLPRNACVEISCIFETR